MDSAAVVVDSNHGRSRAPQQAPTIRPVPVRPHDPGNGQKEVGVALSRVEKGLSALLVAQRACQSEAVTHWADLEDRVQQLEVELGDLRKACFSSHISERAPAPADSGYESPKFSMSGYIPKLEPDMPVQGGTDEHHLRTSPLQRRKTCVDAIEEAAQAHSDKLQSERQPRQSGGAPVWMRVVTSPHFDVLVGLVIVANVVVMSLQLEYEGHLLKQGIDGCTSDCKGKIEFADMAFKVLEHIFTALFVAELVLRLVASGPAYLRSWGNLGDAVIVVVSVVDSWVMGPIGDGGNSNVGILRLMRLVRLSKVLRVVRVMKAFQSLRVLVSAIATSISALAWSMTLLFVLELMGAIFLAQVLKPAIEDKSRDKASREFLWDHFGTWLRSMLTTFEITMAPGGFTKYRMPLFAVHWAFSLFLMLYVCVVTFAVVRVITAMFLKATLSASDQDEALVAAQQGKEQEEYMHIVRNCVEDAGPDDALDDDELRRLLESPRMVQWLEEVDVQRHDADRVFAALDVGSGCVSWSDFVNALLRMKGQPRQADLIIAQYELLKVMDKISQLEAIMLKRPIMDRCSVLPAKAQDHEPPGYHSRDDSRPLTPAICV